jgi:hypothetical protein
MRDNLSINHRGYGIPFSKLSQQELESLKDELTVSPIIPYGQTVSEVKSFSLYKQSQSKLYVPKAFGLHRFGVPDNEELCEGDDINIDFNGQLRKEQTKPMESFLSSCQDPLKRGGIINLSCAGGKCLAKDTKVIMFPFLNLKNVQDLIVGDLIMGDDGQQRKILSVCSGIEKMYKIIPQDKCFSPYVVNESHILSLKSKVTKQIYDININQYKQLIDFYKVRKGPFPFSGYTFSPLFLNNQEEVSNEYCDINETHYIEMKKHPLYSIIVNDQLLKNSKHVLQTMNIHHIFKMKGFKVYLENDIFFVSKYKASSYTYDIQVEELNEDVYYGFEIDGNRRFLIEDGTVTHNTVLGLYAISQLKKKTLIVVHKNFLQDQWIERINSFLPTAKIGIIRGKCIDVENKDIVIGSLQSLSMKDYDPMIFKGFGFVIIDEIHRTGTEVFSQAFHKINSRYSMGLTATLERTDGLTKVFTWFIGDVVYRDKSKQENIQVKCIPFFCENKNYSQKEVLFNGKMNFVKMVTNITQCQERNQKLAEMIWEEYEKSNFTRRFLILSERVKHLDEINNELLIHIELFASKKIKHTKEEEEDRDISEEECEGYNVVDNHQDMTGFYTGSVKAKNLKESESKTFILATYAFVSEGFDVQGLDTLVLTTSKTKMEQIVGRIVRQKEEDRINTPLILDVYDDFSVFKSQFKKRKTFYKSQKYSFI